MYAWVKVFWTIPEFMSLGWLSMRMEYQPQNPKIKQIIQYALWFIFILFRDNLHLELEISNTMYA